MYTLKTSFTEDRLVELKNYLRTDGGLKLYPFLLELHLIALPLKINCTE